MLLFCDKQLFQEWILAEIQNKVLIFGGMTACRKGRGTAFLDTETPTSLQLCSFSFILPHQHPLINIKPSSQLSSSPFSFLNCFYFLTSFLCNKYYQKSESFSFFLIVAMERAIFSSRKGGGAEGEGRATYENWELASVSFQQYPIKSFHYHTQNNKNTVGGQFSPRTWMNQ